MLWTECLHPSKIHVDTLTVIVIVFGDGAWGRYLVLEEVIKAGALA